MMSDTSSSRVEDLGPLVVAAAPAPAFVARPRTSRRRASGRWLMNRWSERVTGVVILAVCAVASVIVPLTSRYDPNKFVALPSLPPSATHFFGTDELGRDLFVRVMAAIRINLGITFVAVLACLSVGTAVGILIGLSPKPLREFLLRLVDALLAIPYLVLVLCIVSVARSHRILPGVSPSVGALVVALSVTGWSTYARIAAVQTQVVAGQESITAVRMLGYSRPRILVRHVLPQVLGANLSLAGSHALVVVSAVASLAFLGAGVAPPTPELGAIMYGGTPLIATAWWIPVMPGAVTVIIGIGFTLIADSVRRK